MSLRVLANTSCAILIMIALSCSGKTSIPEKRGNPCNGMARRGCGLVTMQELAGNPTLYDGKQVIVTGYELPLGEELFLCFSIDDVEHRLVNNAILLETRKDIDFSKQFGDCTAVMGTFHGNMDGKFHDYAFGILKNARFYSKFPKWDKDGRRIPVSSTNGN